ncbi:MAG: BON domain-containing protein [Candidatus Sulfotelmatobacter sp.]
MNQKSLLSSCLLFALILSVGCAKKPNDTQISSDIQNRFSQDSGLSAKQLGVQSANGVVTLSGNVDNDAQREAAARQAASVAGVKEVVNNLQVGNANAAAAPVRTPAAQPSNPAPPDRSKPAAGKGSHNPHGRDSAMADNSQPSSQPADSGQMDANNNPPAQPAVADSTPQPPPAPKKFIIDQGTQMTVRLMDPIDSEKNQTGDNFHATLKAPLSSDGEEAVPAGVELTGHLVEVKSASKFAGQSEVILQLDSLTSGGQTYSVQTDQYKKTAASRGKNTAEKVGGGAVLGGIIGALAGGGKGAAIGAAAGAGVGGGVQAASKSQQIKLPSETVLSFTLQAPITVVRATSPDASRQKLDNSQ